MDNDGVGVLDIDNDGVADIDNDGVLDIDNDGVFVGVGVGTHAELLNLIINPPVVSVSKSYVSPSPSVV
jgi:hypothetical protein